MTYGCSDFTDTILDALNVEVPDCLYDDPSTQADMCLEVIAHKNATIAAMLVALGTIAEDGDPVSAALAASAVKGYEKACDDLNAKLAEYDESEGGEEDDPEGEHSPPPSAEA